MVQQEVRERNQQGDDILDRKKEKKELSGGVSGLVSNVQGNQPSEQSWIQGWPHRELMPERPFASKRQLKLLGMVVR